MDLLLTVLGSSPTGGHLMCLCSAPAACTVKLLSLSHFVMIVMHIIGLGCKAVEYFMSPSSEHKATAHCRQGRLRNGACSLSKALPQVHS